MKTGRSYGQAVPGLPALDGAPLGLWLSPEDTGVCSSWAGLRVASLTWLGTH